MVFDALVGHRLRVEQIASVEDEGAVHAGFEFAEVGVGELRPFCSDDEGVSAIEAGIHVVGVGDLVAEVAESFGGIHSLRVPGGDRGAFGDHALGKFDGDRFADIVGVLFEGEAPEGDFFLLQHPEVLADFVEEEFELGGVDVFDLFEEVEGIAE